MRTKDPNKEFDAIGVKYFDVAEGLSPDLVKVLNTKLDQMKERFEELLHEKTLQVKHLERRVQVQENLNKEGVKYGDLKVEKLVNLLWEMDQIEIEEMAERHVKGARYEGAKRLWLLLEQRYGEDYFLDIIEDRFGMANEQSDQIDRQIRTHCDHSKRAHDKRLDELQNTYEAEIKALKQDLRQRNEEMNVHRRKVNLLEFSMT